MIGRRLIDKEPPDSLKLTREEIRNSDAYKDLTDEQADELIKLVWVFAQALYNSYCEENAYGHNF